MRTATIQIRKDDASVLREAGAAFVDAWKTGASASDLFTFSSRLSCFRCCRPSGGA